MHSMTFRESVGSGRYKEYCPTRSRVWSPVWKCRARCASSLPSHGLNLRNFCITRECETLSLAVSHLPDSSASKALPPVHPIPSSLCQFSKCQFQPVWQKQPQYLSLKCRFNISNHQCMASKYMGAMSKFWVGHSGVSKLRKPGISIIKLNFITFTYQSVTSTCIATLSLYALSTGLNSF